MFFVKAALSVVWTWITGGGANILLDIYNKHKDSALESERLQAQWAAQQLAAIQSVRIATAGFWEMRVITAAIAAPFVVHLWAVGLDTIFKLGWRVSAFPKPFDEWEGAILLSFFGLTAGVTGLKAIAAAVARR